MKWFDRKFAFDLPHWMAPNIVERLRGTPARLEERIKGSLDEALTRRLDDRWSIKEHAGHLLDLEPLWLGRVDDIYEDVEVMREADLTNAKTHNANHNQRAVGLILSDFREARSLLIQRVDAWPTLEFNKAALHPRLKQPMRLIDLLFFVAEHDDHHLAEISRLIATEHPA